MWTIYKMTSQSFDFPRKPSLNDYVQPICLWDVNKVGISDITNKFGTVIGWGVTEADKLSVVLRQATMPIVSLTTCLNSNREFFGAFLSDKTFCAGFRNGTSVCNGDSGGSITFEENGVYRIRGLVSLTVARRDTFLCNTKEYVVFTDVAQYLTWIDETIAQTN
ncbi:hypothetical protein HA402_012329 [Bradysia odoriphaga]|nr:hypothetical protein HA402_012329 [Bradysia odoriphaga]